MTAPKSFYVIAVFFLLWSLLGNVAFVTDATQDLNALAKVDAYQAQLFRVTPQWVWAAYAIAVWSGALASIALLLRRKIAVPLYVVSLVATVIQYAHTFLGTDTFAVRGLASAAAPAFDTALGVIELLYSRWGNVKGWLR